MTQTRTRKPKPQPGTLGSISLAQWRDSTVSVAYAQNDPRFSQVVTVLTNERINKMIHCNFYPGEPVSESQRLGIERGYDAVLEVLRKMQSPAETPQSLQDDAPNYAPPADQEGVDDV